MTRIILFALAAVASLARAQGVGAPPLSTPPERQFDFWIGEWDVVNRFASSGGWVVGGRATCKVTSEAGGRAIVEHWHGVTSGAERHGFSVRAFDPELEKWVLVLNWPGAPDRAGFGILQGVFRHGRGEFFAGAGSNRTRYSFSDITDERLRWDSAASKDGGRTWHTDWIMEFTRRPAEAEPLANGSTGTRRLATLPILRELDFVAGDWSGTAAGVDEDGSEIEGAATLKCGVILEGLAVTDSLRIEGEHGFERFGVSCFDARAEQWVRYVIDSRRPVFEKQLGKRTGSVVTFVGHAEDVVTRFVIKSDSADSLVLVRTVAEEDEAPVSMRITLTR